MAKVNDPSVTLEGFDINPTYETPHLGIYIWIRNGEIRPMTGSAEHVKREAEEAARKSELKKAAGK
jgi:hypothetical protein